MFSILEKVIKIRDFSHFLLESPFFNVVLGGKCTNMEEESFQSQFFHKICDIWVSLVAQLVKNRPAMQETWVGKIPWRREWLPICSILAWRIQWTEEPGRPQSMGSQRVGYDWATFTHSLTVIFNGFFFFFFWFQLPQLKNAGRKTGMMMYQFIHSLYKSLLDTSHVLGTVPML